ncbi:hypothetical protein [Tateyamaria sp. syn59]|uniref:hypothetical protein n=1 Tax=Tateyamaria sp. syn59 TaxID=2576942 RepID=UPI0011BF72F8|nr:hypothetical protein [Tateyamaria sp. syn59]
MAPQLMADLGLMRFLVPMEDVDGDGRSLLEGRSILNRPAPGDYRQCRYPGSRRMHAKPMNVKALSIYVSQRDSVDHWISSMLGAQHINLSAPQRFLFASHAAYHTPKLWLYGPEVGPVPPVVATAAKICHGVYELALHCVRRHSVAGFDQMDADAMIRDAEAHDRLIGRNEVCAGPPPMIRETLRLLLGEVPTKFADATPGPADVGRAVSVMQLYWRLERLAILNTLVGLSTKRATLGRVVTFPNAIRVIQAVQRNQPLSTSFVSAYQCVPPAGAGDLAAADRLMKRHRGLWSRTPEEIENTTASSLESFSKDMADVLDILRETARAFGVIEQRGLCSAQLIEFLFGKVRS